MKTIATLALLSCLVALNGCTSLHPKPPEVCIPDRIITVKFAPTFDRSEQRRVEAVRWQLNDNTGAGAFQEPLSSPSSVIQWVSSIASGSNFCIVVKDSKVVTWEVCVPGRSIGPVLAAPFDPKAKAINAVPDPNSGNYVVTLRVTNRTPNYPVAYQIAIPPYQEIQPNMAPFNYCFVDATLVWANQSSAKPQ
jgi:hypothetical protein